MTIKQCVVGLTGNNYVFKLATDTLPLRKFGASMVYYRIEHLTRRINYTMKRGAEKMKFLGNAPMKTGMDIITIYM